MRLPDDPDILHLLPAFCMEWGPVLATGTWPPLLASRNAHGLWHLGHSVKGSFAQFGFPQGSVIGDSLVLRARDGDWEGASRDVADLLGLIADIQEELRRRNAS